MSGCEWIICEKSSRWAAALRMALERDVRPDRCEDRLHEVRSLAELSERLSERRVSLAAIEVRRANLGDVLKWLSTDSRRASRTRFVTLLDRSLQSDPWEIAARGADVLRDASDALREAGATDIVVSPRRLGPLIELGRRHAANMAQLHTPSDSELSFSAKAWASLPWQAG
jgi:hypothetical protein